MVSAAECGLSVELCGRVRKVQEDRRSAFQYGVLSSVSGPMCKMAHELVLYGCDTLLYSVGDL